MIENIDYELIPQTHDPDAWAIRIMTGAFVETVIVFGAISFNKVKDQLEYSFSIVESPDTSISENNVELQNVVTQILESIIESGIEDGSVSFRDVDDTNKS